MIFQSAVTLILISESPVSASNLTLTATAYIIYMVFFILFLLLYMLEIIFVVIYASNYFCCYIC